MDRDRLSDENIMLLVVAIVVALLVVLALAPSAHADENRSGLAQISPDRGIDICSMRCLTSWRLSKEVTYGCIRSIHGRNKRQQGLSVV